MDLQTLALHHRRNHTHALVFDYLDLMWKEFRKEHPQFTGMTRTTIVANVPGVFHSHPLKDLPFRRGDALVNSDTNITIWSQYSDLKALEQAIEQHNTLISKMKKLKIEYAYRDVQRHD